MSMYLLDPTQRCRPHDLSKKVFLGGFWVGQAWNINFPKFGGGYGQILDIITCSKYWISYFPNLYTRRSMQKRSSTTERTQLHHLEPFIIQSCLRCQCTLATTATAPCRYADAGRGLCQILDINVFGRLG